MPTLAFPLRRITLSLIESQEPKDSTVTEWDLVDFVGATLATITRLSASGAMTMIVSAADIAPLQRGELG